MRSEASLPATEPVLGTKLRVTCTPHQLAQVCTCALDAASQEWRCHSQQAKCSHGDGCQS